LIKNVHKQQKIDVKVKISQPKFTILEIAYCPDKYLSEKEKVIKELMLDNNITEKEAKEMLDPVLNVMDKHGIVFYIP
jgi:hypothetical protein